MESESESESEKYYRLESESESESEKYSKLESESESESEKFSKLESESESALTTTDSATLVVSHSAKYAGTLEGVNNRVAESVIVRADSDSDSSLLNFSDSDSSLLYFSDSDSTQKSPILADSDSLHRRS